MSGKKQQGHLHVREQEAGQKDIWETAAGIEGQSLSEWVRTTLDTAASETIQEHAKSLELEEDA